MSWAPAKYRSNRANTSSPCAVQLPITQIDTQAFVIVDEDGTVQGGILGTVTLFPHSADDLALGDWQAAVAWAKRLLGEPDQ